jgi:predicted transcriptional regulator
MSGSAKVIGSIDVAELFGEKRITIKPKGYSFVQEVADAMGLSHSHTAAKLRRAHDAGQIERVMVSVGGKARAAYNVTI